ncbi:hypothetical protein HDV57DRAFT_351375 [Trichoderma longibrachiatum]|uniref:Uncharacterized protein n=1 Tax=Trichoderma longibrachiatum ATCC 18648 TaxID=983965 RepID=A0A2T4BR92_TRILO|nr:hypothetical protein M440DRAFT_1137287 [Trichoderma longibrachiatum ATCC 18648]
MMFIFHPNSTIQQFIVKSSLNPLLTSNFLTFNIASFQHVQDGTGRHDPDHGPWRGAPTTRSIQGCWFHLDWLGASLRHVCVCQPSVCVCRHARTSTVCVCLCVCAPDSQPMKLPIPTCLYLVREKGYGMYEKMRASVRTVPRPMSVRSRPQGW